MAAGLDVLLALGSSVSEAEALETLKEGRVVLNSDSLMVDVDAFEFEELESDGRADLEDDVEEVLLPVLAEEPELDVVIVGLDRRILLSDEADDVSFGYVLGDTLENDEGTDTLGGLCSEGRDGRNLSDGDVSLLDVVELDSDLVVGERLDSSWSEGGILEGDACLPSADDVL